LRLEDVEAPIPPKKHFFTRASSYQKQYDQYLKESAEYDLRINQVNALNQLHAQVKKEADWHCYFCHFRDLKFSEIHHLDGNHFNNAKSNLVCACTLCHRQHHLLWLSIYDHAELGVANIDHLTQTELNHIQRIAIVMKDDPAYAGLLGINGKLGAMLTELTFSFSRPLHAFMIPDTEKEKSWKHHLHTVKLNNPLNGNAANYSLIELALSNINNLKPTKPQKDALDQYDAFIGLSEIKRADSNANDDDIRNKFIAPVREAMAQYKKQYEADFEQSFNDDRTSFSIFELAMALNKINYSDYKEFDPKYMYLVYKHEIFTEEQIAYYKTLDYFKVENWGFGGN
uniref:HNH endonuclease signature motif containing protein n=1 Tax=Pedobacter sp. TaxID=1411316 RepID=UPI003D7FAE57